jgi:GTP-binding protein
MPVVALIRRPNVGKSTLFNRLVGLRDALVADVPGLTRDRQYGEAQVGDRRVILVDTGGLSGGETGIDAAAVRQSLQAAEESDLLLFVVDARAGLLPADRDILDRLRRLGKPLLLLANKVDAGGADIGEFHGLGVGEPLPVSAAHGQGIRELAEYIESTFADWPEDGDPEDPQRIRIAIVGRPNVGKSTLVNRLLGEERVVVYDEPGTTRDSIYVHYVRAGQAYTLIDTAGVRRRRSVTDTVEKFSIVKTLQAIADAQVVLLLVDAREGLVDQDLHLLGRVLEAGKALVIACNKWDGLASEQRQRLRDELERRLTFARFAELFYISALHGTNVGNLYAAIGRAHAAAFAPMGTNRLTRILQDAVREHQPPTVNGRRIKLRYAHAGGSNPPLIVVHGNQTDAVPAHYQRYLENVFRRELALVGTPLRIQFQSGSNPYEGRRNRLTPRQQQRRKRLIKHVKKRGR